MFRILASQFKNKSIYSPSSILHSKFSSILSNPPTNINNFLSFASFALSRNFASRSKASKSTWKPKSNEEKESVPEVVDFHTVDAHHVSGKKLLRKTFASKLKTFKPKTPSLRHLVQVDRSELWKGKPWKPLTKGKHSKGGRHGTTGRISVRGRGGGHKKLYREIDFKRDLYDVKGTVQRLEYDPNRTGYIALVLYENKALKYILHPEGLQPGDTVISTRTNSNIDINVGNCMPLTFIPVGATIHNVELRPGKGGQIARGAGTSCRVIDKSTKPRYALIELQSKEQRYVLLNCSATIGAVGNKLEYLRVLGKAGRMRWFGFRPKVRGMAMNPIDHPMGGGNGKSKGRHPCSPTGVPAKGYKTRDKRKINQNIILPRGVAKNLLKQKAANKTAKTGS